MSWMAWLFVVGCVLLTLPVLLFTGQVLLALLPERRESPDEQDYPPVAVLVPAHNESSGIAKPLQAIRPQLRACDRLLVVADNCSDDTAEMARASGAAVIERNSSKLRGKGYALDFGVRHLAAAPPAIVIVVDADCLVHGDAIPRLSRRCAGSGRPIQALYLMFAPPGTGLKQKIAEFAWTVKNRVRPLGYRQLGLPCQLMGTGMAFPWRLISQANLASGHIVEDLKLGLDLAAAGHAPEFCPQALVTSAFPRNDEGAQSQRTRWEHGHMGMLLKEGPVRLAQAFASANIGLLALAGDMCVPPLALLVLLTLGFCAIGAIGWAAAGTVLPWGLPFADIALLTAAVLAAWGRFGRESLSLGHLAYAPLYALAKLPLYLRFLVKRQAEWVRSRRD